MTWWYPLILPLIHLSVHTFCSSLFTERTLVEFWPYCAFGFSPPQLTRLNCRYHWVHQFIYLYFPPTAFSPHSIFLPDRFPSSASIISHFLGRNLFFSTESLEVVKRYTYSDRLSASFPDFASETQRKSQLFIYRHWSLRNLFDLSDAVHNYY